MISQYDNPIEVQRAIQRIRWLAHLLDGAFQIPGTAVRVGLDPILGLLPGAGDALTSGLSLYIVYEGWRLGADRATLAKMLANVAVDAIIGLVPVAGDVADVAFKANLRNLELIGIATDEDPSPRVSVR